MDYFFYSVINTNNSYWIFNLYFSGSDESIKIVFNFALQVLILDTIFVFAVAIIEVVSEIIR